MADFPRGIDLQPEIDTSAMSPERQAAYAVPCRVCHVPPRKWCDVGLYKYVPIRTAPHEGRVQDGLAALEELRRKITDE
jgi:hypothetical protein